MAWRGPCVGHRPAWCGFVLCGCDMGPCVDGMVLMWDCVVWPTHY